MTHKFGETAIDVSCTIGDGPPVTINIHLCEQTLVAFGGKLYPIDLTPKQAIELAGSLLKAAREVYETESLAEQINDC